MSKAIEQNKYGFTVGHVGLGTHGDGVGSVRQAVHDGDTINVRPLGNLGARFLGVDAPEISFNLPGSRSFTSLGDPRWEVFLSNPLSTSHGKFNATLASGLRQHLKARVGPGCASNHYTHALAAQTALEAEIQADLEAMGADKESFEFYLAFSHEVLDRYGRMLCFINRNQEEENIPGPRPLYYNERLLMRAAVMPYFIWPNVSPFRKFANILEAVIPPFMANQIQDPRLGEARQGFAEARARQEGLYAAGNPLRLDPFELRFLAGRRVPNRWLIDLSQSDNHLVHPQEYYSIPNPEDRLYIPEEYLLLFKKKGWKK